MRRWWQWFQARASGRHAKAWLGALAFSEASFFLIPPDILLIPMLAAGAGRWAYLATLAVLMSLLGSLFGYALGYFVFEPIVQPIIEFYHLTDEFSYVGSLYSESTFTAVFLAAFTPIPFKVFVLAGGFFKVSLMPFVLAAALGRSARFYLIAWLAHRYGPRAAELFIRYFNRITVAALILLAMAAALYFGLPAYPR